MVSLKFDENRNIIDTWLGTLKILEIKAAPLGLSIDIEINQKSKIFEEHFPGMAVLPGAFILSFIIEHHKCFYNPLKGFGYTSVNIEDYTLRKQISPGYIISILSDFTLNDHEIIAKVKVKDYGNQLLNRGVFIYRRPNDA